VFGVYFPHVRTFEVRSDQSGPPQHRAAQISISQVNVNQFDLGQIYACQIDSSQVSAGYPDKTECHSAAPDGFEDDLFVAPIVCEGRAAIFVYQIFHFALLSSPRAHHVLILSDSEHLSSTIKLLTKRDGQPVGSDWPSARYGGILPSAI
jgi:hypothetical protein